MSKTELLLTCFFFCHAVSQSCNRIHSTALHALLRAAAISQWGMHRTDSSAHLKQQNLLELNAVLWRPNFRAVKCNKQARVVLVYCVQPSNLSEVSAAQLQWSWLRLPEAKGRTRHPCRCRYKPGILTCPVQARDRVMQLARAQEVHAFLACCPRFLPAPAFPGWLQGLQARRQGSIKRSWLSHWRCVPSLHVLQGSHLHTLICSRVCWLRKRWHAHVKHIHAQLWHHECLLLIPVIHRDP